MSTLSPDAVNKIADLAMLAIEPQDIDKYSVDLSHILELIEEMAQIDTDSVQPLAHALDVTQPLRSDEVTEHDQRDLFQRNAPQTEKGLYLVPQVIEDVS